MKCDLSLQSETIFQKYKFNQIRIILVNDNLKMLKTFVLLEIK